MDDQDIFSIKIVQSGDLNKFVLSERMLHRELKSLLFPLLKELKLKEKEIFLSNDEGKMMQKVDLNRPLNEIIQKFGYQLNLYSEKIL